MQGTGLAFRDRPVSDGVAISDIDDPSDPKVRRWLASRIEKSVEGDGAAQEKPAQGDPSPEGSPPDRPRGVVDEDDEEIDRTELSSTTETATDDPRRPFEATTQTQSPAGMARLRGKLGLPPIPGRPEPRDVLAQVPPAESRKDRVAGPIIPTQRVVEGPASGPLPSGPAPSGPMPSSAHSTGAAPTSSGPLRSGPSRSGGGPSRPAPSGPLPLSTGPSVGLRSLDDAVERSRNRVDPWAEEDDEDEAQTVLASPWAQEAVDWAGEPETVRSWGAMVRREREAEGDPDTVRHSKMPVRFISEAVIDDETVLDPSSGSERWRNDGLYHPPPPDIEPASSPLPAPPSRPDPSGEASRRAGRAAHQLPSGGFVADEEWVPLFSEDSEPNPSSEPLPSGGPPPPPQGVRTIQLPEPPPSVPPAPPSPAPSPRPSPPAVDPPPSAPASQASSPRPHEPSPSPMTPEQRQQVVGIVVMLVLAGGMGFVVLAIAFLLGG